MGGSGRGHTKHGKRLNKFQIERDRVEIARLYLLGTPQHAIAAHIGQTFYGHPDFLSRTTISNDLKAIRKEWLTRSIEDYDAKVALELAKIDNLESEYWKGWEASRLNFESSSVTSKVGGEETTQKVEGRYGDPRFLDGILKCVERRCKLLGLDRPVKVEADVNGYQGFNIIITQDDTPLAEES